MRVVNLVVTRKFHLKKFESLDITLEAQLVTGDDPTEAMRILEKLIEDHYAQRGKAVK